MVVDHLDHFDYKVEYVSNRLKYFDLVIWFGADNYQCLLLEEKKRKCLHHNVRVVNINHKIRNGADFAYMQDLSFRFIKENYNYSICAFQSADELLTDFGVNAVKDWVENSDEKFTVFAAMSNKMFCETFIAQLVFQIFRSGVEYRSNNGISDNIRYCDGFRIDSNMKYTNLGESEKEAQNYLIDIGYISPKECFDKVKNWSRLCYGDEHTPHLLSLYPGDEFVRFFIERHRGEFHGATDHKITPVIYSGEYKRLIDDLGLKTEYDYVCELIKTINDN